MTNVIFHFRLRIAFRATECNARISYESVILKRYNSSRFGAMRFDAVEAEEAATGSEKGASESKFLLKRPTKWTFSSRIPRIFVASSKF